MVKDFRSGSGSSNLANLTNINGTLFFQAYESTDGDELWKSDGTDAGTVMVKDIVSGIGGSYPQYLANVNGTLFFRALDATHGQEVWKSDGTAAGTVMVKDIVSGNGSAYPGNLTNVNGTLFFQAYDGTHGYELWKSDGTDAGTMMVKDINSGSGDAYPEYLTNVNGTLFFEANDTTHSYELWKSDGTDAGTMLVKDINPGSGYSAPSNLTNVNGALFFQADDGTHGAELWVLGPPAAVAGDYTVKQNQQVDLSASATSDPDPSETLTYQWDLDGDGLYGETGSDAARGDEVGLTPTFNATGLSAADYAVSLRVTDSTGLSDTANGTVTVTAASSVLPVGDNAGTGSQVTVHRPDGTELTIDAFGSGFDGGVKTASGDLTGDGTPDIIVAAGTGGSSHIRILNGTDGSQVAGPLGSFLAFAGAGGSVGDTASTYWSDAYNGPIQLASGDVNGDGVADIIVATGQGGSSHVKIFNGADGALLQSFLAFPGDGHTDSSDPAYFTSAFQGGVNVATGDVNNDGKADLIVAAGPGAGPNVKVFAGGEPSTMIRSFFAYDPAFRGGVNVAGGDVDGDGFADILTAPQGGAGPNVKVFSGADGSVPASFWAYDQSYHGGVTLAGGDYNSDGAFDLITTATGDTALGMKQFTFTDGHTPTATALFFATS
jgi:ELWxxDGT repeat protein